MSQAELNRAAALAKLSARKIQMLQSLDNNGNDKRSDFQTIKDPSFIPTISKPFTFANTHMKINSNDSKSKSIFKDSSIANSKKKGFIVSFELFADSKEPAFCLYPDCKTLWSVFKSIPDSRWKIPAFVLKFSEKVYSSQQVLEANDKKILDMIKNNVEDSLFNALLPFQREGLVFGIKNHGRVLIADEMGLGKSIQALSIASFYKSKWPLLIICPASLVANWKHQIESWIPSIPSDSINTIFEGKFAGALFEKSCIRDASIVIISYDLISRLLSKTKRNSSENEINPFNVVILDESHALKNKETQRCRNILPLLKKSDHVILLSGTPALSRPMELYSQISALDPKLFPSLRDYGLRYCSGYKGRWGWDWSGASHLAELKFILNSTLMIRRTKDEVLSQLPPKIRKQVFLKIDLKKYKALLNSMHSKHEYTIEEDNQAFIKDDFFSLMKTTNITTQQQNNDNTIVNKSLFEWRATALVKAQAILEYLYDTIIERGEFKKVLIFAHHTEAMDIFEESFIAKNIGYIRIDGKTESSSRGILANNFQTNENISIALLSITAASTGFTLTAANHVIFAELYWNPGVLLQAEDRAHRIGQNSAVSISYCLAKETADDKIWPCIVKKMAVLEQVGVIQNELSNIKSTNDSGQSHQDLNAKQLTLDGFFNVK